MNYINFEEFLDISWDYVSMNVVSDEYWDTHQEFIRELSFDAYTLYKNSLVDNLDGTYKETLTPKICGKFLECFFSRLIKGQHLP